jgi:SAM-dependent methyltransferase
MGIGLFTYPPGEFACRGTGCWRKSHPQPAGQGTTRRSDLGSSRVGLLGPVIDAVLSETDGVSTSGVVVDIGAGTDLVVSSYALHHLVDRDKQIFVEQAARWLRPGGKLVIGDMMFGRGVTSGDRAILASKVRIMLGRGPGGWWRIAKNAWRFLSRTSERPISMEAWTELLSDAGLMEVTGHRLVAEAAVVSGRRAPIGGRQPDDENPARDSNRRGDS